MPKGESTGVEGVDLVGQDGDATTHQIFALGIVEADALLAVAPLGVVDAGEEVVAGHDQQVLRLQSLIRKYSPEQY